MGYFDNENFIELDELGLHAYAYLCRWEIIFNTFSIYLTLQINHISIIS